MSLEMKAMCEKCGRSLVAQGEAYICSYECTFCPSCAEQMHVVCPNCGGELARRPRRTDNELSYGRFARRELTGRRVWQNLLPVPADSGGQRMLAIGR